MVVPSVRGARILILSARTRQGACSLLLQLDLLKPVFHSAMHANASIPSEDTQVSSPTSVIFSGKVERLSSPPSSPPGFPWEHCDTGDQNRPYGSRSDPPPSPSFKTAFSILGKRKPLCDIAVNVRPTKRVHNKSLSNASKPLTQLQISLGQQVQVKCKSCGMEYVSSSAEDRALHGKFHRQDNEGYSVSKDFVRKSPPSQLLRNADDQESICAVDCHDKPYRVRHAQSALVIVEKELGAAPLSEKAVWPARDTIGKDFEPPYRAYMSICNSKCVGFLLVQRITRAFAVLGPPSPRPGQLQPATERKQLGSALAALKARQQQTVDEDNDLPLQLSSSPSQATMGIARIWTAPAHRHRNIATRLLDAALAHYDQDHHSIHASFGDARGNGDRSRTRSTKSKTLVAFSQPTEAGTRLARRWFGKKFGWLVYVD
nr:n-acetyltransferase eso1 [Quercus suber]